MKSVLFTVLLFALSAAANAGLLTVNWESDTDPTVGWNLYIHAPFTGSDVFNYSGTTNKVNRTFQFHNVPTFGLMQYYIARYEVLNDNGVNRRYEMTNSIVTVLNSQVISIQNGGVNITSASIDPNQN